MIKALIAGQRDPRAIAELAIGKMRPKHADLAEALDGSSSPPRRAGPAAAGPDRRPRPTGSLSSLPAITAADRAMPAAQGVNADGITGPDAGTGPDAVVLPAWPGWRRSPARRHRPAQPIIAEIGLDMTCSRTPAHLVSWAGRARRPASPGRGPGPGKPGKGNPYLRGSLGELAASAARTDTFLGERYRRIARRRGKAKAQVAVARSILVIILHLLADPAARFRDLGPGYYDTYIEKQRRPATDPADRSPRPRRHPRPSEASRGLTHTAPADPPADEGQGPLPPAR